MKLPKMYASEIKKLPIDMSLSENPLGCSPRVMQTLRRISSKDIFDYPDTTPLLDAIAAKYTIQPDRILLGNGSEQLIKLICQTFIRSGDIVRIQRGSFPLFAREALLARAKVMFFDPNSSPSPTAKLIILCNPNNPTGVVIPANTIRSISKNNPKSTLVIDEANGEFLPTSSLTLDRSNIIVLRTFSKVFGLAGLRIGFVFGSKNNIQSLAQNQQIFPITTISSKLAIASLNDTAFLKKTLSYVKAERTFLTSELVKRGFSTTNSITSNIFIKTLQAKQLVQLLSDFGVSVVDGTYFPMNNLPGFRIAIRDKRTNRLFLRSLDRAIACLSNRNLLPSKEVL